MGKVNDRKCVLSEYRLILPVNKRLLLSWFSPDLNRATGVIAISYPTYYGQYKARGFKNSTRFKNVIITIPVMYRNYALITLLNVSLL